jgi:hypothetical protein
MKIKIIFTIIFFIATANRAHAGVIINNINNNREIKKAIEAMIYKPDEKHYPYKGFNYCEIDNRGISECYGENLLCYFDVWPENYRIKYKVLGCVWLKWPAEKIKDEEKRIKNWEKKHPKN